MQSKVRGPRRACNQHHRRMHAESTCEASLHTCAHSTLHESFATDLSHNPAALVAVSCPAGSHIRIITARNLQSQLDLPAGDAHALWPGDARTLGMLVNGEQSQLAFDFVAGHSKGQEQLFRGQTHPPGMCMCMCMPTACLLSVHARQEHMSYAARVLLHHTPSAMLNQGICQAISSGIHHVLHSPELSTGCMGHLLFPERV